MSAFFNENDPKAAEWLRELISGGHIAPGIVDERSIADLDPNELTAYTQCHFFAGIGGWSCALRLAGWPGVFFPDTTRPSAEGRRARTLSMHRICNFSGGWCSFFAAKREVDAFGPLNCTLLFADTLVEDPELYAFNEKASAFLGVPITRVSLELTPWQLFRRERMIGNNRFPICSVYLKRELLDQWMLANFNLNRYERDFILSPASVAIGFDWTEEHRTADMRAAHPNWEIRAPMQEGERWDKCRMQREAEALGFVTPEIYRLGFPHFNCGGRCVRAGISHWVHLYHTKLAAFEEWENEEWNTALFLKGLGIEPLSMLKDRRGGVVKNLYLRDLRARIDGGELFDRHDWGGCGCGGAQSTSETLL